MAESKKIDIKKRELVEDIRSLGEGTIGPITVRADNGEMRAIRYSRDHVVYEYTGAFAREHIKTALAGVEGCRRAFEQAREMLRSVESSTVAAMRQIGYTWEEIGDELNMTTQAAHQRFKEARDVEKEGLVRLELKLAGVDVEEMVDTIAEELRMCGD